MTDIKFKSDMDVDLIDLMGDDETVAKAARVSTGNDRVDQGDVTGLLKFLTGEGHTSTLEHCTITVRAHVPIFVHRQLMTHRTLSKNSESGRYRELQPVFYVPDEDRPLVNAGSGARPVLVHSEDADLYSVEAFEHMSLASAAWDQYKRSLARGTATEVARNYLPVTTYTSLYMTGNLLGWFNFLRLRLGHHGHPQAETQEVAKKVSEIIAENFPVTYKSWVETQRELTQ